MELFRILGTIALNGAEEAGEKMDKLRNISSKLGNGIKTAGKAFAGFSTAVGGIATAIGAAAVKVGADFDKQMSAVKSISGATVEEFEMLREKAKEMGATTSFSATESAQALEYMAMAGWDAQQMSDGLAGIMNLAAASGEDLAATSDIVTDAMTAFGMKAEESEYFSDVLAKTASSANTNVSMMGETFKYVAPLAGAMGYSIEDMSVAIGLMANSGIKGSQSGTSLRNIITNLASPTDDVAKAMEDLGISLTDNDGNIKSFDETLGDLRESFSHLDEVERANYASTLAGKEGMSGFLALVNSSDEDFEKLSKQIENCSGAAKEMADVRLDNLSGDVTLFKSALEGAGIEMSEKLSPVLRDFVQGATDMIPKIGDGIAEFGGKIAEIAEDMLPLIVDVAQKLMSVMPDILGIIGDLIPAFAELLDMILPALSEIVINIAPVMSEMVKSIIEALKPICKNLLPPLVKLAESISHLLSEILDMLSPIVTFLADLASSILGTIVEMLGDMAEAISRLMGYDYFGEMVEEFSKLTESEQAAIDKTTELAEKQEELHTTMQNGFGSIDGTYQKYDNLIGKLDTMVDSTGKVKEGYEKQVDYILNELNDAFGTEMTAVDGKIQKYQEEKQAIEDLMAAKKAEAYLTSAEDEYVEALKNEKGYQQEYAIAVNELKNAEAEKAGYERQKRDMEIYAEEHQGEIDLDEYYELEARIVGVDNRISELKENKRVADKALSDNSAIIANFDKMTDAIANNDIPAMEKAMQDMSANFIDAKTGTSESLRQQTIEFSKSLNEMEKAAKIEGSAITEEQVNNARIMYQRSLEEWSKLSGMSAQELEKSLISVDGFKVSFGASGYGLGSEFTSKFQQALSEHKAAVIQAAMDIANGVSSISANVKINSPSDLVYYSSKAPTATGGIVTHAQTRLVGEDGAEAIIPLERNTEWIDKVAARMSGSTSNSAVAAKLDELISLLKNQKIYLDGKTLVGGISGEIDKKLGSMARLRRRTV